MKRKKTFSMEYPASAFKAFDGRGYPGRGYPDDRIERAISGAMSDLAAEHPEIKRVVFEFDHGADRVVARVTITT